MDRRTLLRLAGLGAAAGSLSACGIASHDGIVVDGTGPAPVGGASGAALKRPSRSQATDEKQLVRDFFYQPAGDDGIEAAGGRCRSYLLGGALKWQPTEKITVVWIDEEKFTAQTPKQDDLSYIVTVEMYALGTFVDDHIEPDPVRKYVARFWVTKQEDAKTNILSITKMDLGGAPNTLLMSTSALALLYEYRNLYYWSSTSSDQLVPDARYRYKNPDSPPHRPIIEMLLRGPGPLIAGIVKQPSPAIKLKDTPTVDGGRIIVNLTQPADLKENEQKRLVSQLSWTLLTEVTALTSQDASPIQLRIESTTKVDSGQPYQAFNVAATRRPMDQKFAVVGGKIRRLKSVDSPQPIAIPLLDSNPTVNQNVDVAACLARKDAPEQIEAIAVVHNDGAQHQQLTLIPATAASASKRDIAFPQAPRRILRPVFIDGDNLLVVADGALYHVRRTVQAVAKRITVPGSLGGIISFGLSPEGRRLAFVTPKGLFVVALNRAIEGEIAIAGSPRPVPTVLSNVNGVGFIAESWLAVAGSFDGELGIMEVSLDGGLIGRVPDRWLVYRKGLPDITAMMAYPDNPRPQAASDDSRVFYTANSRPFENTSDLSTEVADPTVEGKVVNPFFLE